MNNDTIHKYLPQGSHLERYFIAFKDISIYKNCSQGKQKKSHQQHKIYKYFSRFDHPLLNRICYDKELSQCDLIHFTFAKSR